MKRDIITDQDIRSSIVVAGGSRSKGDAGGEV